MSSNAAAAPDDDAPLAARLVARRDSAEVRAAQDALLQLYRRHAPGLLAFLAARVPRADLEDVHQTVWMNVWNHAPTAFDRRHFRGWLYRIARNLAIDQQRRKRPEPAENIEDLSDRRTTKALDGLIDAERQAILERCLEKLNEQSQAVVRGRLGGEEYPELCARLRIDTQKTYKVYFTAVQQLRDCVKKGGA